MNTDAYLSKLENTSPLLEEPIRILPPQNSSFYWKNRQETKYKVFLPTENRLYYINLEEYDYADIRGEEYYENWHKAKKVVQFAFSENDQLVMNAVTKLKSELRRPDYFKNPLETTEFKYFVFYEYYVNQILRIPLERRHEVAIFNEKIAVSPYNDRLINAFNSVFEETAKYFYENEMSQVCCYNNTSFD